MLKQIIPVKISEFVKSNQRLITFLVKFLLAVGLLYFLIVKLDYKEIYNLFLQVDLFYLSFAFLLVAANLGLRYTKWYLVSKNFFPEIKSSEILSALFNGIVGYLSIPLNIGEFLGRSVALKKYGTYKVILATAIDNYTSQLLLVFLGSLAWAFYLYDVINIGFYGFTIILVAIISVAFAVILLWLKRRSVLGFIKQKFGERKFLTNIKKYFGMVYELNGTLLLKVLLVSVIYMITYLSQFTLLMLAFGAELSVINLYWISLLVMVSKSVIPPITFGELGIREGITVYFAKSFLLPVTVGFNAAFSLFVINIILPAIVGLFFVFRKSK